MNISLALGKLHGIGQHYAVNLTRVSKILLITDFHLCEDVTKLTLGLELDYMTFNRESVYYLPLLGTYCTSSKEKRSYFVESVKLCRAVNTFGGKSAIQKDLDRLTEMIATS